MTKVEEKHFKSVRELVDFILRKESLFFTEFDNYIFRGDRDNFPLIPSLLRGDILRTATYGKTIRRDLILSDYDIPRHEERIIRDFFIECDLEGLVIPEIEQYRDAILSKLLKPKNIITQMSEEWPPSSHYEIFSIAQHYGLPTRLLDWSLNIFTAIYFAARGVMSHYGGFSREYKIVSLDKENEAQRYFIIWALNKDIVDDLQCDIKIIRPMYHKNKNLTAQKGVFTLRPFRSSEDDKVPLEQYIECNATPQEKPILYKFYIPQNDAIYALEYIKQFGISEKSIFPGFEGVTQYIKRQNHLL